MKIHSLLIALIISTNSHAAQYDCPIEEAALLKHLKTITQRHPSVNIDVRNLRASWVAPPFQLISVEVGGCEHFNLSIRGKVAKEKAASEYIVFKLAKRLAQAVLPPTDAATVAASLQRQQFTQYKNGDEEVYVMPLRGFQEFSVGVIRRGRSVEVSLAGTGY